ncbi:hypothetical protein E4U21_000483 [Claviceps maximensis]|nr:hypothetical protein E4U21_000483 [Claviceps maximensis]
MPSHLTVSTLARRKSEPKIFSSQPGDDDLARPNSFWWAMPRAYVFTYSWNTNRLSRTGSLGPQPQYRKFPGTVACKVTTHDGISRRMMTTASWVAYLRGMQELMTTVIGVAGLHALQPLLCNTRVNNPC